MSPKASVKKTGPKTGRKMGELVKQAHGGALLNGMAANHVPGPGRPPSEVRKRALRAFDETALPVLERLARSAELDKDKIAAANVLSKAGLSDAIPAGDVKRALAATIATIQAKLDAGQAAQVITAIEPHWVAL